MLDPKMSLENHSPEKLFPFFEVFTNFIQNIVKISIKMNV
jgi:hypothetical protein